MDLTKDFIESCKRGDLALAKLLLANGADVHFEGDDALIWASSNGHRDVVKLLLARGADARAQAGAPLFWAIEYGREEVVNLLEKHIKEL